MKIVSEEKFDSIMNKRIELNKCKKCGHIAPEIVVRMPLYGRYGASVRCANCGMETKIHGITYVMADEKRLGTPTIEMSLMYGIKRAIQDWNGGKE